MKSAIIIVGLFVVGASAMMAGIPVPSREDCAKAMCRDMRSCAGVGEVRDKSNATMPWTPVNTTTSKKAEPSLQRVESGTCYQEAYTQYQDCFANGVEKPDAGNTSKTQKKTKTTPSN